MSSADTFSVAYTVRASFPDTASRDDYIAWLINEHIADVIAHGAQSGCVIKHDSSIGDSIKAPFLVEARYIFSSRDAYETYINEQAPKLRAIGLAKFAHLQGVSFERTVGVILPPSLA